MIACLCHLAENGNPNYLDHAPEIPWLDLDRHDTCHEPGPHWHACTRPNGHGGRHLETETLDDTGLTIALAVWSD